MSNFSSKKSACKYLVSKGWVKHQTLDTDVTFRHPEMPGRTCIVAKTSIRGVWRVGKQTT